VAAADAQPSSRNSQNRARLRRSPAYTLRVAITTESYEVVPEVTADAEVRGRDLIVMKFGGTSVGDIQKIKDVARRLVTARETGQRVVGVLSAMGDTTDELIRLAH